MNEPVSVSPIFDVVFDGDLEQVEIESKYATGDELKDAMHQAIRTAAYSHSHIYYLKIIEVLSLYCEIPKLNITHIQGSNSLNLRVKFDSDSIDDYRSDICMVNAKEFKSKLMNVFRKQKVRRLNG